VNVRGSVEPGLFFLRDRVDRRSCKIKWRLDGRIVFRMSEIEGVATGVVANRCRRRRECADDLRLRWRQVFRCAGEMLAAVGRGRRAGRPGDVHRVGHTPVMTHQRERRLVKPEREKLPRQQTDRTAFIDFVAPKVMPPPITDRPPEAEPRQVSMPAAARPGAATVGVVITCAVVFAGLLMSTIDDAPDVLPTVWA